MTLGQRCLIHSMPPTCGSVIGRGGGRNMSRLGGAFLSFETFSWSWRGAMKRSIIEWLLDENFDMARSWTQEEKASRLKRTA